MKTGISILALSLAVGMAMAQTDSQDATKHPDATSTPSANANPKAAPSEMKTSTFKGVLVDMSCAGHTAAAAPSSSTDAGPGSPSEQANSANRTASDASSSCAVSSNSTEFGMKMDKGQTVRFDLVGNQRAQEALKNEKSWNKNVTANKPIHATVSGVLDGDKLIVSSIH